VSIVENGYNQNHDVKATFLTYFGSGL